MTLHLAEISRHVTAGAHAVVVLDGAGWHKISRQLVVPDNISLLTLPAYSPELNPQENVWQYLRQNYLSNRVFDTYGRVPPRGVGAVLLGSAGYRVRLPGLAC